MRHPHFAPLRHDTFTLWHVLHDWFKVAIFSTLLAAVLSIALPATGGFKVNFLFSITIGTTIVLLIDAGRWVMVRYRWITLPRMAIWLLCALPLGYLLGWVLASYGMSYWLGCPVGMMRLGDPLFMAINVIAIPAVLLRTAYFVRKERYQAQEAAIQLKLSQAEKAIAKAQLARLQAQIEPHFLFNTLANVQVLIETDPPTASNMLGVFSDYLRHSLCIGRQSTTTLAQEFDLIRVYLDILVMRMGSRLTYTLDLPDSLREQAMLPMLLQPLVENAVTHGLAPLSEGGHVDVKAKRQDDQLVLTVWDNGAGLQPASSMTPPPVHGHGVGLANIRERLAVHYEGRASLELQAALPRGVLATLIMPLTLSDETQSDLSSSLTRISSRFFCPIKPPV